MDTAISDLGVMLLNFDKTTGKYKYLIPVTAAPATGGAPNDIEVTELDSFYKQNIPDREDTPKYEFDYNYTKEKFKSAKAVFDGTTSNKFLLLYQDKSAQYFKGRGVTWMDAVSRGAAVAGKIAVSVEEKEWVESVTNIPAYAASTDTAVDSDKVYFTRAGTEGSYTYTVVAAPTGSPASSSYYEMTGYVIDTTSLPADRFNPFSA